MPQARMRKLACMGLLNMLTLRGAPSDIINFLPQIVVAVVGNIPESSGWNYDSALCGQVDEIITLSDSAVEKQLQNLMKSDIVFNTNLHSYMKKKLEEAATLHGPNYQAMVNTIDPIILKGLTSGAPPPVTEAWNY